MNIRYFKKLLIIIFISIFFNIASSKNIPTLTIYTYSSFVSKYGPGEKLQKEFEKECQCKIKWITFNDFGLIINRLRLDKNRSNADIVLGLDNNTLLKIPKNEFFIEHNIKTIDKLKLPVKWDNKIFLPYDYGYFAFVYNSNKLKNPPKSLEELINREDIKIIYQDPRISTLGIGLTIWLNTVFEKDTIKTKWKKLSNHTVTIGKNWSETYGAFLKGEADMVLSYYTSPLFHIMQENNHNIKAANFKEGHLLNIETIAILKNSKNKKLAKDFLEFILTPKAQKIISIYNVAFPVIDIKINDEFSKITLPKTLFPKIDRNELKEWVNTWQNSLITK